MSAEWNFTVDAAVDRAAGILIYAVVADAQSNADALRKARHEFLRIATWVGPSFQDRVVARAAERLIEGMPEVVIEEAERAIRNDCRRIFGRDLCWANLGAVEPWGTA